jgi:hypothetical protein
MSYLIIWDRVGSLGGKGRQLIRKVGEWYVERRHLQGCSLRLCRLRTDGVGTREKVLNVPITCWWYGPSKPSNLLSIDAWLCPHCFIGWFERETGYGSTDRSTDMLWIMPRAPFLESSDPAQLCWRLMKCCHIRGPPAGSVRRAYVDWHGKRMCRVDGVFSCSVYIDLNRRDSQIWVTACLWQSSRR